MDTGSDRAWSRRSVLRTGAASIAAVGVAAGCSDGPPGDAEELPTDRPGQVLTSLTMPIGQSVRVDALGPVYIVTRTGPATAVAFSATCPHTGCSVQTLGPSIACPCHGSVFDNQSGAVVRGPAARALDPFAVDVVDGNVVTA